MKLSKTQKLVIYNIIRGVEFKSRRLDEALDALIEKRVVVSVGDDYEIDDRYEVVITEGDGLPASARKEIDIVVLSRAIQPHFSHCIDDIQPDPNQRVEVLVGERWVGANYSHYIEPLYGVALRHNAETYFLYWRHEKQDVRDSAIKEATIPVAQVEDHIQGFKALADALGVVGATEAHRERVTRKHQQLLYHISASCSGSNAFEAFDTAFLALKGSYKAIEKVVSHCLLHRHDFDAIIERLSTHTKQMSPQEVGAIDFADFAEHAAAIRRKATKAMAQVQLQRLGL